MSDEKEKDLLYKLQVLKNALLSERKKSSDLENEVLKLKKLNNDLERDLELKDKEITKNTNEKHKLISQIDFHRHKSFIATGVTSDFNHPSYFYDVDELTESIKKKTSEYKISVDLQNPKEKEIYTDTKSNNSDEEDIVNNKDTIKRRVLSPQKDTDEPVTKANNNTICAEKNFESNLKSISNLKEKEISETETKSVMSQVDNKVFKILDNNINKNNNTINTITNTKKSLNEFPQQVVDAPNSNSTTNTNNTNNSNIANNSNNLNAKNSISHKLGNLQLKFGSILGKFFNNNDNISHLSSPRSGNSLIKNKSHIVGQDSQQDNFSLNGSIKNFDSQTKNANTSKEQVLIANYELVIHHLQTENTNQKNLLSESNKNILKVKEQFQALITSQIEKIKNLELELNTAREDLVNYTQSTSAVMNQNKTYEVKINNNENTIKQLQGELTACKETIKKFQLIIEDKETIICSLQENLKRHEIENTVLARKLAELKNAIMDENIRMQVFSGKRKEMFTSANFNLTFTKSDDGFFLALYQEENGKNQETINLDDIENVKVNSASENSLDFIFMKNKKLQTWLLYMNENIHQVIRVYRDFRERATKQKNMLYY